jgi:hypothetical protein
MEIDAVGYSAAASGKDERSMSGVALQNRTAAAQTELAPMFDVLKHLDIRVYRKIWNCIRKYWKDEKWIRVTDDPSTVRFVGLNRKVTKGQLMLEQAQSQKVPPEQLAAMQQQIAADPSMQEMVAHNSVDELDVDIVIDDAPDSVTVQQEEFIALSEMVKSGIPIPPSAIIEASSLKNKDKIIQEMRQGAQLPPEIQDRMQTLQEEGQKLAQENQALKADQSTEHAKIQAKAQADQAARQMDAQKTAADFQLRREEMEREFALKKEMQEKELQLAREKAEGEASIKLITAGADAEISERKRADEAKQGEQKLQMQQEQQRREHEMKAAEQARADESTAMPNFQKVLGEMMKAIQGIVASQEKMVEQNAAALKEIAAAMSKKGNQTVTLSGIKRDSEGLLTSASATLQ